jgi:hypothetical protein
MPTPSIRHCAHASQFRFAAAGVAACSRMAIGRAGVEMVPAALRIHPHDGILWAMFLRLLFGPASHQDLRPLRASCEGERKGREEQSRKEPREHRQIRPPYSPLCLASVRARMSDEEAEVVFRKIRWGVRAAIRFARNAVTRSLTTVGAPMERPAVERQVAADRPIHIVLDNYATHKHAKSPPSRRRGCWPG